MNRADIVRFFDDVDGNGNALINGTTHTVKLPNNGGGNVTPFTVGASIVLVYRTHTDPLRAIVFYDGGFTINQATDTLTQPIQAVLRRVAQRLLTPKPRSSWATAKRIFTERLLYSDNLQTPPATPPRLTVDAFVNGWDNADLPSCYVPWRDFGDTDSGSRIPHAVSTV